EATGGAGVAVGGVDAAAFVADQDVVDAGAAVKDAVVEGPRLAAGDAKDVLDAGGGEDFGEEVADVGEGGHCGHVTRCVRSTDASASLREIPRQARNDGLLLLSTAAGEGVVLGVGVGDDEGGGGLFGVELVAVGDADADGWGVEEAGDEEVLG